MIEFETRKLHISIPLSLYEMIRDQKKFKEIDGIVTRLLTEELK